MEKGIVIRFPHFSWRALLSPRFGIALACLLTVAGFAYWFQAIRPYLWISGAYVEAYSAVVNGDGGRIIEMRAQEGERVQRGQTLVLLDRDAIFSKQAQAKQALETLQQQSELEKRLMSQALENYLAAVSELEMGLSTEEKVSRQLLCMEEAQTKASTLSTQLTTAQATFTDLDLQMKKMTLDAPFDGVILKRIKNPGAVVSFGEPIYVLCDPERLWIEAEIPEEEVSRVHVGTPVRIRLPAYPAKEWSGHVTFLGPATVAKSSLLPPTGNPGKIALKISFDATAPLQPGLSACIGLKIH